MKLTITSLEWLVRNEDVKQITVDTFAGQITILPGHDNLISVLKPGLIKIIPSEIQHQRSFQFLVEKEYLVFWCLWWVIKVEWDSLQILTNMIITDNQNPIELLQKSKDELQSRLQNIKSTPQVTWSDEKSDYDLEIQIQKIEVEMKIAMWKSIAKAK